MKSRNRVAGRSANKEFAECEDGNVVCQIVYMNRPSVEECLQGFERILDKINPQQMIMLRAHYHSGGRAVTMRELAKAAGYADHKMANLQYGNLAKRLYQAMGFPALRSESSGKTYWIFGLGRFVGRSEFGLEMNCVMRPEIAEALERLGIVEPSGTPDSEMPDEPNDAVTVKARPEFSSRVTESVNAQKTKTSETHPIRVDFMRNEQFPILNRLGMTFAPGKKQSDAFTGAWDRDLKADLERLFKEFGVGTLVSLLEDEELAELQIRDLAEECDRAMINLVRFPVRDVSVPESMDDFVLMIAGAVDALKRGETVVTHCKGGLGRAGLTGACIAIAATDAEISSKDAIELVRAARPGTVETEAQEQFVAEFEEDWREIAANRGDHYLLFWQERSVREHAANDLPLDVIASNQLMNVFPGDIIWIVTFTQERNLVLAGRLTVGEVVEYEEAIRRMPDAGLWQAEYYAFPEPGTEEYIRETDIQHLAGDLRFESENDRLILRDGKVNPQQLQRMRKLTRESAEMLDDAFYTFGPFDADDLSPEAMLNITLQLVEMTPEDPDMHYNLGVALGRNGMDEKAAVAYEKTLKLDPQYFGAQYNLGGTLIRLGRFDEAVEALNKAVLINGDYPPGPFHARLSVLRIRQFPRRRFGDATRPGDRPGRRGRALQHRVLDVPPRRL